MRIIKVPRIARKEHRVAVNVLGDEYEAAQPGELLAEVVAVAGSADVEGDPANRFCRNQRAAQGAHPILPVSSPGRL